MKIKEILRGWFKRAKPVEMPVEIPKPVEVPIKIVPLKDIIRKYAGVTCMSGTDKGGLHSYIESYHNLLSPFVGKGITLLEIGIATGKSLLMWQEFLQNAKIYGMDIQDHLPVALKDHSEITTWKANSTRKEEVVVVGELMFDVIIDDGSHQKVDQIATARLMMSKVKPGGLYIIEDVQSDDVGAFNEFGKFEFIDLRGRKGVYDDMLIVFRFG